MTVSTRRESILSVLKIHNDGNIHSNGELCRQALREWILRMSIYQPLSPGQSTVENRIGCTASYLTRVNVLDRPPHAYYRIMNIGPQFYKRTRMGSLKSTYGNLLDLMNDGGNLRLS